MRPTTSLVVGLLLLLPAAFSADLTQYLAPGEAITDQNTFVVGGVPYTLVYINGEPTFLLDGSQSIITDHTIIGHAVNKHFTDLYYPTDAEMEALRADFESYHDSRNNGDDYPGTLIQLPGMEKRMGMEEEVCRYSMFLNVFPCTNSSNCYYSALFMCDEYGDALGCTRVTDIQPAIEEFSFASNHLTWCADRAEELFENMDSSNIRESLAELKGMIPGMLEDEAALESTRFRLPKREDRCTNCLGLCPRILINEWHLEDAEEKIDALLRKTEMLGDYSALGALMGERADARVRMAADNAARNYYHSIYDSQKVASQRAVSDARALLAVVANSSVMADADRADVLIAKIDADLLAGRFADINASMDELRVRTGRMAAAIPGQWELYNSTEQARGEAAVSIFILETSSLNEEQAAVSSALSARKKNLDRGFVAGLTPERYAEMRDGYRNITETAEPIVRDVSSGSVYMSPFMAAARSTNEGVLDVAAAVQPMSREDKEHLSEFTPLMLSTLSFFSLGSLLTFGFLFFFAKLASRRKSRAAMFMGFVFLGMGLLLVGAVSAGAYFTLKGASSDADFSEYRASLAKSGNVAIIVEGQGVSPGALAHMKACAQKIAGKLSPRQATVYEKTNGDCITLQGSTVEGCYNAIEEPIVTLRYSAIPTRPEFSVVFVDSAVFTGDEQYFQNCEIAAMMAVPLEAGAAQAQEPSGNQWVME